MATTPQQGIMALPETDEASAPQLPLSESYDAAKQGLTEANPEYTAMYDNEMSEAMPALMALTDEQLDSVLQLVQYLQESPEEYPQRLMELEQEGVIEKGDFPEQYDENFLSVFGAAVLEAQRTNEDTGTTAPTMQPPMQLAKGGIAEAARMVSKQGRSGDTMLAHITKKEADLLKKHGGMGTRNPRTGLQEYGLKSFVKSVVKTVTKPIKAVSKVVKKVLASPIGRIAATVALAAFIGPGAFGLTGAAGVAAQFGIASAGITALGGGGLKDVIKAGVVGAVTGYGGAALGPALGIAPGAASAAAGAGLTGVGVNLAQGRSISDSVKSGLTSAVIAGAISAANSGGFSRGTGTQDGSNIPVEDRLVTPENVGVNPQTGQVNNAAQPAVSPQASADVTRVAPPASSDAAFNQAMANAQQPVTNLSTEPGINVRSTSADPLGDFASQNEAFRTAAGAPAPKPEPTFWEQTKQAYNEYLSPSGRAQAGGIEAIDAKNQAMADYKLSHPNASPADVQAVGDMALKANTPGMISTYGPAVAAAGVGAAALGAFEQKQPEDDPAAREKYMGKASQDIINADPTKYLTQNLPGVSYDASGNITGSSSWTPRSGAGTTQVAGNYIGYTPSQQVAAPNMLPNFTPVPSPNRALNYNVAPQQYDFAPRYAAQGGMMETAGAFPANPLSMSNPAMAMQAQQMPMNTSGVPMNMPMGFAMGGMPPTGIASLATGGYPRRTGQISGPGTPTSDSIPAMLSDGEFVFTEKAVRGIGDGSRRAGAKKMYALMHHLEKNASRG